MLGSPFESDCPHCGGIGIVPIENAHACEKCGIMICPPCYDGKTLCLKSSHPSPKS